MKHYPLQNIFLNLWPALCNRFAITNWWLVGVGLIWRHQGSCNIETLVRDCLDHDTLFKHFSFTSKRFELRPGSCCPPTDRSQLRHKYSRCLRLTTLLVMCRSMQWWGDIVGSFLLHIFIFFIFIFITHFHFFLNRQNIHVLRNVCRWLPLKHIRLRQNQIFSCVYTV